MDSQINLNANSLVLDDTLSFNYKTIDSSNTDVIFFEEAMNVCQKIDKFSVENKNSFLKKILLNGSKNKNSAERTKTLVVTEKKLLQKFEGYISNLTQYLNLNVFFNFIEEGDFFKQASEVQKIHEFMLENNFEKNCIVIGLGGGKITDLAGYVASTYFRGVSLILIPTNLLAMVDASVGGKTGINHYKYGKNVIGTISQPNTILINLWMLDDLESELISDGMGEIIKMCALLDSEMFNILKLNNIISLKKNKPLFYSIVKKNIKHKINVVTEDAKDSGFRNILNFGHTVGHAVESLEAFNISHGKSVSIGLCAEAQLACMLKKTPEHVLFEIKEILETYGLPTEIPNFILANIHELIEKFKTDKKNNNQNIRFIYVKEIGKIQEQIESGFFLSLEKNALLKFFSKRVYIDNQKLIFYKDKSEEKAENKNANLNENEIQHKNVPDFSSKENTEKKIIRLKGSKSICNRALILAALGKGKVTLENFLFSEDTIVMIKCLKQLGIPITIASEDSIIVEGSGTENFKNKNVNLFVENAGTAARFLTGFCLLFKNSIITIDGIARMRERPIDDLLDCVLETQEYKNDLKPEDTIKYFNDLFDRDENFILKNFAEKNFSFDLLNDQKRVCFQEGKNQNRISLRNNFEIVYLQQEKKMPFCIITSTEGFQLKNENSIKLKSKKSSQFVSSLLLISPFISVNFDQNFIQNSEKQSKNLHIVLTDLDKIEPVNALKCNQKYKKPVSYQYIEMTLKMMGIWGIKVQYESKAMDKYTLEKHFEPTGEENKNFFYVNPRRYKIEPDASTANFYLAHVALNGGNILLDSIGSKSIQGDSKFFEFLRKIRTDFTECTVSEYSISIAAEKLKLNHNENDNSNKINISKNNSENKSTDNNDNDQENKILFDEDISIITDSFLALGVVCSQIPGEYYLRGIENQAIKECNRLQIFCENLNSIGVFCTILKNNEGIYINSTPQYTRKNNLNSVEINTANDHRVAMSFAILAKFLPNTRVYIDNKNCINKTYPEFWLDFERLFGLKYSVDDFNFNKSVYKLSKTSYANKPVFLVGMRSCGKTSFGKAAARKLNLAFYDLDDLLVQKHKNEFDSIADIVLKKGWDYFRSLERELFMEIYRESYKYCRAIIACGGGIVENEEILIALKTVGNVVFIDTPLENIEEYIKVIEDIKNYQKYKNESKSAHLNKDEDKRDDENGVQKKDSIADSNRPGFSGNKDFQQIYNERLGKYKQVAKFVFKTPFVSEIREFIDLFDSYKKLTSASKDQLKLEKEDLNLAKIQEKIEFGIANFKAIIELIGDMFANFVYLTCSPMHYPIPNDNSYFLCAQVNEDFLNKLALVKKFYNKLTEKDNYLANLFINNNNVNKEGDKSNPNEDFNHKIISLLTNNEEFINKLKKELNFSAEEITNLVNFLKIDFSKYNAVELRFDYLLNKILSEPQEENTLKILVQEKLNFEFPSRTNSDKKQILESICDLMASIIQDFRYISLNKTPIIFTIRSTDQGGFFNSLKHLKEYNSIKKQILKFGVEYIDIEFRKENITFISEFYQAAKEHNTSVILSNHFIESQIKNDLPFIKKSVFTMSLLNSDILKIITNFDSFSTNKKEFLELKIFVDDLVKKPLIFFQLGDGDGKLTRLANSFFLPVYDKNLALPTGKGQLSLGEIKGFRGLLIQDSDDLERFDYKVIGTSVAFSPSPSIYAKSVQYLKNKGKLENDFDVDFGYHNINYEEEQQQKNLIEDDNKNNNNNNFNNDKTINSQNAKSIFEASEFYRLVYSNKLLMASITIPFKTLLLDLHSGKSIYNLNQTSSKEYISYDKNKLIFSEESLQMNSVNCIKKINKDKIMCFNTDWIGNYEIIVELLQKINKDLSATKILVLGAGGAANAIMFSLKQFNFLNENIYVENRSKEKALLLAKKFNLNVFNKNEVNKIQEKFDIVISTIPKDCETEILEGLSDFICERTVLVDLAYTKPGSGFITNFKKVLGTKSDNYVDGILFLLKQAYYSFELFFAKVCPRKMLEEVFLRTQN